MLISGAISIKGMALCFVLSKNVLTLTRMAQDLRSPPSPGSIHQKCHSDKPHRQAFGHPDAIRSFLEHLGLWLANARPIPKAHSPPVPNSPSDGSFSQLPAVEEQDYSQIPPPQWEC